jgi:hypothetical protein
LVLQAAASLPPSDSGTIPVTTHVPSLRHCSPAEFIAPASFTVTGRVDSDHVAPPSEVVNASEAADDPMPRDDPTAVQLVDDVQARPLTYGFEKRCAQLISDAQGPVW